METLRVLATMLAVLTGWLMRAYIARVDQKSTDAWLEAHIGHRYLGENKWEGHNWNELLDDN